MTRTVRDLKSAFSSLILAAANMGLTVNQGKTKYMVSNRNLNEIRTPNILIGLYQFERVETSTYLGSTVHECNDCPTEINGRILSANRCYFGLLPLKSQALSRKTKITLYKVLLRPALTYGSETRVMTKQSESVLRVLERKILRRILGPLLDHGQWRRRKNEELYQLYKDYDVVKFVKLGRLRWAGHVLRMDDVNHPNSCCSPDQMVQEGGEDRGRDGVTTWRRTQHD
ncbi:hypothetical protein GE061_009120 [Apolygus lucorum]|uniref:Reverse transcriptase domain-containing protein n=1 Tax=Apolygus lucorum TaxID=248454 RepID=A0A6A4K781_APOLU|nr:hypothetical protein GE061_009120 [Apolygus lucorum]